MLQRPGEEHRGQQHGGDDGDGVGLEEVGRHAGAVAHVVAHVVSDHGRIARVVLGDAGFHLAHQIGTDVGALGEDAAAQPRKDRDQRAAEAERHQRLQHDLGLDIRDQQDRIVDRDAEQAETHHQEASDRTGAEGDAERRLEPASPGRISGPHVRPHRDVHADVAGRAGKNRADEKADAHQVAEQPGQNAEQHQADQADGDVLAVEVGPRAFLHGTGDLLHALGAGARTQDRPGGVKTIGERDESAGHGKPKDC